ncbi:semaphorin-4A [Latimeria chalumnae]|uniref:semaphorin-4A n=1 Tax=Latimeria chalumnae TaxID=7897 RepID=UPI00313C0ED2
MHPWKLRLLWSLAFLQAVTAEGIPRTTFFYDDPGRLVSRFSESGVWNYTTLLLAEDGKTLYVGARDTIFSLNVSESGVTQLNSQIHWSTPEDKQRECHFKGKDNAECCNFIRILQLVNKTHLYACGTYAFNPTCVYIDIQNFTMVSNTNGEPITDDGTGRCPFNPRQKCTAIMVEGELYAGTTNNFKGNEPIISRNLGNRIPLKTETSRNWLYDPSFVGSTFIPGDANDNRVYFFFNETAEEFDFFEKTTTSRIARVCTNDVGGKRVLQKRWTTYVKAQLSCSVPGQLPFSDIQDSFSLVNPENREDTIFYGIFNSQWWHRGSGGSAVCAFSRQDVDRVFNGKFKILNKETQKWVTHNDKVPDPRPGSCKMNSSLDSHLVFVKDHFLMEEKILPIGEQPSLVNQQETYTKIVVDTAQDITGKLYTVMFLGTESGFLHKVVSTDNGPYIIEAIQLFKDPQPVENLLLSPSKGVLFVGSASEVVQVPLSDCSVYKYCGECVLARDPYCAWNTLQNKCQEVEPTDLKQIKWVQDVEMGNVSNRCDQKQQFLGRSLNPPSPDPIETKTVEVSLNTIVHLDCPLKSALAMRSWKYNGKDIDGQPYYFVLPTGRLMVVAVKECLGLYECLATENGFQRPVVRFKLEDARSSPDPRNIEQEIQPNSFGFLGESGTRITSLNDGQVAPVVKERSYWTQLVVVTVIAVILFLMVVLGFLAFTLRPIREKLKSKAKVQSCSTPEAAKLSQCEIQSEKVPLNQDSDTDRMESSRKQTCHVQMEAGRAAAEDSSDSLKPGLQNGDTSQE